MAGAFQRLARWLALGLCGVLALALACMALAVLVQALAVLLIAAVAGALLLPHPLTWYAEQAAEAVKVFFESLFGVRWERKPSREDSPSAPPAPMEADSEARCSTPGPEAGEDRSSSGGTR